MNFRILGNLALALVTIGLLTVSCAHSNRVAPIQVSKFDRPVRVACIGDSITYGLGVADRERNSYPSRLGVLLGDRWQVRNFGVNGATLLRNGTRSYWTQQAYRDALSFEPDIVVIKLGTNDTKREDWEAHRAEFISDYLDFIRSFQKLKTKPRIYLCLPVPLFRDRGKVWDTDKVLTDEVIPKIKAVAQKNKLPVIDLYAALDGKAGLFPDGVHPNASGAAIMAQDIYDAVTGLKPKVSK